MNFANHKNAKYLGAYLETVNNSRSNRITELLDNSNNLKTRTNEEEEDEDESELELIIETCPPTKLVREFFRDQLTQITNQEDNLFLNK